MSHSFPVCPRVLIIPFSANIPLLAAGMSARRFFPCGTKILRRMAVRGNAEHCRALARRIFIFMLIHFFPVFSYPLTNVVVPVIKPDLNRETSAMIRRVLSDNSGDLMIAEKLIGFRKKRGEIGSFSDLLEAGLSDAEIELVKKCFAINAVRKDPDEILKNWKVNDTGFFYGLLVYPMDLNSAGADDLCEFPCFGAEGAAKILAYRMTNEITGLLELTNAGLEKEKLLQAAPFVTLRPVVENGFNLNADIRFQAGRSALSNAAPSDTGEMEFRTTFDIRPMRFYFATVSTNNPFLPTNFQYTDWYGNSRYYALVRTDWAQLIAGHYRLQFGRNLLFGPVFPSLGREIGKIDIGKDDKGAVPATSTSCDSDNNGLRDFFNGFAATLEFRELDLFGYRPSPRFTGFFSTFDAGAHGGFTNQTDYGADMRIGLFENSFVGCTLVSQYRADGKFTGTGLSLRYNLAFPDILEIYSEAASFTGFAGMQGVNLRAGPWKISLLGFWAATNYLAPNASDIVHSHRDAYGFFAGLGFEISGLVLGISADSQWKISSPDEGPRRTIEFNAEKTWDEFPDWIDVVEARARARYSDNSFGETLRSFFSGKAEFFQGFFSLECGWQDLRNFTVNESGDMTTVRIRIAVNGIFSVVFRWNGYASAGYHSALYDSSEAVYPGDLSVQSYYGRGNEYSLVLKWEVTGSFSLNCGVHQDLRAERSATGFTARTVFAF